MHRVLSRSLAQQHKENHVRTVYACATMRLRIACLSLCLRNYAFAHYVSLSLSLSLSLSVCMHACMQACMYVCMHVCRQACMHVSLYACMHACMHAYICLWPQLLQKLVPRTLGSVGLTLRWCQHDAPGCFLKFSFTPKYVVLLTHVPA